MWCLRWARCPHHDHRCHVRVREPWASQLPPPSAEERGMLDFTAEPAQANSRLACQITLTDALDGLTVDLPATQY